MSLVEVHSFVARGFESFQKFNPVLFLRSCLPPVFRLFRTLEVEIAEVQQVLSSWCSFAAIRTDGSVVTWGDPKFGGDSSMVQEKLIQVQQIAASRRAFAALLANGSVVTWGDPDTGGDSSDVQEKLKEVCQLEASYGAFGAILADGSVVATDSSIGTCVCCSSF